LQLGYIGSKYGNYPIVDRKLMKII